MTSRTSSAIEPLPYHELVAEAPGEVPTGGGVRRAEDEVQAEGAGRVERGEEAAGDEEGDEVADEDVATAKAVAPVQAAHRRRQRRGEEPERQAGADHDGDGERLMHVLDHQRARRAPDEIGEDEDEQVRQ